MNSVAKGNNLIVNTIPMSKITVMLNEFIVKSINHLNKLSVHVENKLINFDNKIREIEVMVKLLESKLNSLPPEITSTFPSLTHCSLNDINPEISLTVAVVEVKKEEIKSTEPEFQPVAKNDPAIAIENSNNSNIQNSNPEVEQTPDEKLKKFMETNNSENLENFLKMMKYGIHSQAVIQKALMTGFDMSLLNSLLELYKATNPNY